MIKRIINDKILLMIIIIFSIILLLYPMFKIFYFPILANDFNITNDILDKRNSEYLSVTNTLKYKRSFMVSNIDKNKIKHTLKISINYDYILNSDDISKNELNKLVFLYFTNFQKIFNDVSYEYFDEEDSIVSLIKQCKEFVDSNKNEKISFYFYLSGLSSDKLISIIPEKLDSLNTVDYNEIYN